MKTTNNRISNFTLIALIGIVLVVLGLLAFSLIFILTDWQVSNPNSDNIQPLRGTITQLEQGKDGVQVALQTENLTYNITISQMQTEIIGDFDQIKVGTEIEVSGQGIDGMDPPLIIADRVVVLETSNYLTSATFELITYNGQQPILEQQPSLQFDGDQVSGNTGCNLYGGSYRINGDEINFEGIYSTEMACLEPEGIMEQERTYLELLSSATRFKLYEDVLTLFAGTNPILIFVMQQEPSTLPAHTLDPSPSTPSTDAATVEVIEATSSPVFEPHAGTKEYQDTVAGVSIYIPENWAVTGIIEGEYAIFQSYPEDKYVGGEARQPGDTKCDLNLHPSASNVDDLIEQWETSPLTSIISDEEIVLKSGLTGRRFVLDSMGPTVVLVVEINHRMIKLTCFGNFTPVDDIGQTLSGFEPASLSPIYESAEGFKHYQDTETGVSIDFPESWIATGIVPGERVTLQSYPENKYIGGEAFELGDTKCDLSIRNDIRADDYIDQMKSNESITIITTEQIRLNSGKTGSRFEIDSFGRAVVVITEIKGSTALLTCYGDLMPFDGIAITLKEGQ